MQNEINNHAILLFSPFISLKLIAYSILKLFDFIYFLKRKEKENTVMPLHKAMPSTDRPSQ
jgi:hypothetical protein